MLLDESEEIGNYFRLGEGVDERRMELCTYKGRIFSVGRR